MFPARRPPFRLFNLWICWGVLLIQIPDPVDRGTSPNAGYQSKVRVIDRYKVIGFISSGTYGRVYKAVGRDGQTGEFAIKKFKPGSSSPLLQNNSNRKVLMTDCRQGRRTNTVHRNITIGRPGDGPLFRT